MTDLMDRIIPPAALRWGRLTVEPYDWHVDSLRYVWLHVQATIAEPFVPLIAQMCVIAADMADAAAHYVAGESTE